MRRRGILVALLLALAATTGEAQIFRYMAFGDSITKGRSEFDPTGQGGYPGRLDDLLTCMPPTCEVINQGKDGEKTGAGVTRIQNVLDSGDWDVVILMHGTNDIFNEISNNTIETNLGLMDDKARDAGTDTLHGSIIHLDPDSTAGMDSGRVSAVSGMRTRVMNMAAARNRYFADPWTPLCPTQTCFNQHYHNPPGAVGHPDPSGFDILAGVFHAAIVARPVPALPIAVAPTGTIGTAAPTFTWNKEAGGDATWYEFRLLNSVNTVISQAWLEENATCVGSQCTRNIGALADGDYTWEVRGRNPRGRSGWVSTPFTVQTLLPPTEPLPAEPEGVISEAEPAFGWGRETPKVASNYRLEVSDTGGVIFDDLFPIFNNCDSASCSVEPFVGAPLPEGSYSWRVRGENSAGNGPWAAAIDFDIDFALIFYDGFESGDTSAWSSVFP